MAVTRPLRLLASGWLPALLVYAFAVLALRESAQVGARDSLAITAWVLWGHALPGTIAWRTLDWRPRRAAARTATTGGGRGGEVGRPFLEDVVIGTTLGIVLALPVYALASWAGHPRAIALWPLLALLPALALPRGRRLLLRRQAEPSPWWWSVSLALLVAYVVAWSGTTVWVTHPMTDGSLQREYVDAPYHLALVAELRHHFPPQAPFVDGTRLEYHWLFYVFAAAATWGSGVETVVVTRLLAVAVLSVVLVLGVAVAASRLSGRRWAAPLAVVALVLVSPLDPFSWTSPDAPWLTAAWLFYISPTQAMANALCPLLVVLAVGVLRGGARRPLHWAALALVMLAVAGSKSAMLPLFVAGLAGTSVVLVVVRRRVPWATVGMTVLSVGVFVLATRLFYGAGSRSMSLVPFQVVDGQALRLQLLEPGATPSTSLRLWLSLVFVVCVAAPVAGGLGLLVRGGWRRPVPWLLLGAWGAGVAVYLVFRHPALGQGYFYRSGAVPAALLTALGVARLLGPLTRRTAAAVVAAGALGLAWVELVGVVVRTDPVGDRAAVVPGFLLPIAVTLGGIALAGVVVAIGQRRLRPGTRPVALGLSLVMVLGACTSTALATLPRLVDWRAAPPVRGEIVPDGGLAAARWLRDHSTPDQLVATNVHSPFARSEQQNHRQFWISAYSERRVLVEGWAYIAPETVGLPSNEETNRPAGGPFWDPERLRLNDRVFTDPTPQDARLLHERYGVDWLFVDRARDPDLRGLREVAQRRYANERYVVLRLTG